MEALPTAASGLFWSAIGLTLFLGFIIFLVLSTRKNNPSNPLYFIFGFAVVACLYPAGFQALVTLGYTLAGGSPIALTADATTEMVSSHQLWYDTVLFVCSWLLLTVLTAKTVTLARTGGTSLDGSLAPNQYLFKNIQVGVVLVAALYFSISSIVAIPIVNYEPTKDLAIVDDLQKELNNLTVSDTTLANTYAEMIEDATFVYMDSVTDQQEELLDNLLKQADQEVTFVFLEIEQLKGRALSRMEITDNSKITAQLKLEDKIELLEWFMENRSNMLNYLTQRRDAINQAFTKMQYVSSQDSLYFTVANSLAVNQRYTITELPPRPVLGANLGVFTFFTGWLLGIESYPLVVITGLIGFGLLGASASTFIKELSKTEKQALIDDLAGVLIKGFTAAIVVFLGVQGSLAVLTTDTNELNAYALFFVCFVAAVYSDNAWNWARKRFAQDFDGEKKVVEDKSL